MTELDPGEGGACSGSTSLTQMKGYTTNRWVPLVLSHVQFWICDKEIAWYELAQWYTKQKHLCQSNQVGAARQWLANSSGVKGKNS